MFALLALICFVLALFGVTVGEINLSVLGFCFIALQLMYDWRPWPSFQRVQK